MLGDLGLRRRVGYRGGARERHGGAVRQHPAPCTASSSTAIVHAIGAETVIFEAPQRAQQTWLLQHVGPNVNLGNIRAGRRHPARDATPRACGTRRSSCCRGPSAASERHRVADPDASGRDDLAPDPERHVALAAQVREHLKRRRVAPPRCRVARRHHAARHRVVTRSTASPIASSRPPQPCSSQRRRRRS